MIDALTASIIAKIGLIRTLKRRIFGHLIGQHSDSDVGIYSDTFCSSPIIKFD